MKLSHDGSQLQILEMRIVTITRYYSQAAQMSVLPAASSSYIVVIMISLMKLALIIHAAFFVFHKLRNKVLKPW